MSFEDESLSASFLFRQDLIWVTLPDGGSRAIWVESGGALGPVPGLVSRSFDVLARPVGTVEVLATNGALRPDARVAGDGVWLVFDQAGAAGDREVVRRAPDGQTEVLGPGQGARFLTDGAVAWRSEFGVDSTHGPIWQGSLAGQISAANQGDNSLVVWSGLGVDGFASGIGAALVTPDGARLLGAVNTFVWGNQLAPQTLALPEGGWLVGWSFAVGSGYSHRMQQVDASGTLVGAEQSLPGFDHDAGFEMALSAAGGVHLTTSQGHWLWSADGLTATGAAAETPGFDDTGALDVPAKAALESAMSATARQLDLSDGEDLWLSVTVPDSAMQAELVTYWSPDEDFDLATAQVLAVDRPDATEVSVRVPAQVMADHGTGWVFLRVEDRSGGRSDPITLAEPVTLPTPADLALTELHLRATNAGSDLVVVTYEVENTGEQTAWDAEAAFYWSPDGGTDALVFLSTDRVGGVDPDGVTQGFETLDRAALAQLGNGYIVAQIAEEDDWSDPTPLVLSTYDWGG